MLFLFILQGLFVVLCLAVAALPFYCIAIAYNWIHSNHLILMEHMQNRRFQKQRENYESRMHVIIKERNFLGLTFTKKLFQEQFYYLGKPVLTPHTTLDQKTYASEVKADKWLPNVIEFAAKRLIS